MYMYLKIMRGTKPLFLDHRGSPWVEPMKRLPAGIANTYSRRILNTYAEKLPKRGVCDGVGGVVLSLPSLTSLPLLGSTKPLIA